MLVNNKLKLFKRLVAFFVGMFIIQLGVALFLKMNMGSDPFTVFDQGLAFVLHITPGQANIIILVCLTIVIFFTNKRFINIGTVICVFGVGPIIDFSLKLFSHLPVNSYNVVAKILILFLTDFVIAVGFSILSAANLGFAPNDSIYFIISEKIKKQYKWVRICTDVSYLIIGFLLGGVVGVGTVISALLTGPFVQLCLPYGKKLVDKIIEDDEDKDKKYPTAANE